jgi:hypothetical protein
MAGNRQLEILDDLLNTAERNFDAAVRHAASVDDKAQKASGLASIFLAVAFGFVKPESISALQQQYGTNSLWLLGSVLLLLVASVGLCLRAMWLRKVPVGGISLSSHEMSARFLLQVPLEDLDDELMAAYKDNQIEIWKSAIAERLSANAEKTRLLHYAQRTLAAGILIAAVSLGLLGYAARSAIPSKQEKPMPEQRDTPAKRSVKPAKNNAPPPREKGLYLPRDRDGAVKEALETLRDEQFIRLQLASLDRAE